MIEKLKKYLDENEYDMERDVTRSIVIDEGLIEINFRVDEDFDVTVNQIYLADEEGDEIDTPIEEMNKLNSEVEDLIKAWVGYPDDTTITIEGRIYR